MESSALLQLPSFILQLVEQAQHMHSEQVDRSWVHELGKCLQFSNPLFHGVARLGAKSEPGTKPKFASESAWSYTTVRHL
jgi:hypothetical protein